MRDFRSLVVPDHGRERGHQHQRPLDVFVNLLQIGFGALDQEPAEIDAAVGDEGDGVGDVGDHQRLVDVHFEIPAGTPKPDRHVVSHDLHGKHCKRFALGWIDLARHDRGAGLVLRDF